MTDQRILEPALREVLQRRRPGPATQGLRERVGRIPEEVRPQAPRPIRFVAQVGVPVGLAAAAAVLFMIASARWPFGLDGLTGPSATPQIFDPVDPRAGLAEIGPFGLPWVAASVVGLPFAVVGLLRWRSVGRLALEAIEAVRHAPAALERIMGRTGAIVAAGLIVYLVLLVASIEPLRFVPDTEDLTPGSIHGPGLNIGEVQSGIVPAIPGTNDGSDTGRGPRYVYPVGPGEPFTQVASIRNVGPLPIRLLGLPGPWVPSDPERGAGRAWIITGLGLLRDPAVVSGLPEDVRPFEPVDLAPGAEVVIVMAGVGGPCAIGEIDDRIASRAVQEAITGYRFIYEVLGWRREGTLWPPFAIEVPPGYECLGL